MKNGRAEGGGALAAQKEAKLYASALSSLLSRGDAVLPVVVRRGPAEHALHFRGICWWRRKRMGMLRGLLFWLINSVCGADFLATL